MIRASSSGEAGRAWRTAIVLAAILAALVLWDHRLDRRDRALRERSLRIGRVLADVDPQGLTVRELRITLGSAPALVYSPRLDGLWRCLTAQAAPVRVSEMELVVRSTLGASGVVRSADPDAAPRYGIGTGQTIRLSLHGRGALEVPGSDLLFEVEIGDCIPDADTCFVRRAGSPEIWAVEGNLRRLLLPSQDGGLPLIDPNVIPRVWPGARELPLRVRIERAGDEPFELERQDSGGEAAQPGEPAPSWTLRRGARTAPPPRQDIVTLYAAYLTRAPHRGLLDPRLEPDLELDAPRARVLLHPVTGPPLELRFAAPIEEGVPVFNSFTGNVYLVEAELARLLAPVPSMLDSVEAGERWLRVLRREG